MSSPHDTTHEVLWNDTRYPTLEAAAAAVGVPPKVLRFRLKKGYRSDAEVRSRRPIAVRWNGIDYPTIAAAAEANHISRNAMCYRLFCGYTQDSDMLKGQPVTYQGVTYANRRLAAHKLNVSLSWFRELLRRESATD